VAAHRLAPTPRGGKDVTMLASMALGSEKYEEPLVTREALDLRLRRRDLVGGQGRST
jgi:hypothetical protein